MYKTQCAPEFLGAVLQLAAAGRALAAMGPPGRLEDAHHVLAGLRALTQGPLPKPVALALPTTRVTTATPVRCMHPQPSTLYLCQHWSPCQKQIAVGAAHFANCTVHRAPSEKAVYLACWQYTASAGAVGSDGDSICEDFCSKAHVKRHRARAW